MVKAFFPNSFLTLPFPSVIQPPLLNSCNVLCDTLVGVGRCRRASPRRFAIRVCFLFGAVGGVHDTEAAHR